jgi:hypothetical protein
MAAAIGLGTGKHRRPVVYTQSSHLAPPR